MNKNNKNNNLATEAFETDDFILVVSLNFQHLFVYSLFSNSRKSSNFFSAMASAKNTKKSDVDVKQEDIIIAVLIADSFSTRFAPITVDKPKVYIYCFSFF